MSKEIYAPYNQINQEFDVIVMKKTEIKNLKNQEKFLVLLPKHHPDDGKQPTIREILLSIQQDVKELKQWKQSVDIKLEGIDSQFKKHGWTKN